MQRPDPYKFLPEVPALTVASGDVSESSPMGMDHASDIFGAGGSDISPQLSWSGMPEDTESIAVTCCDPDAPVVSGFWHWAVANLPGGTTELLRGASSGTGLPDGAVTFRNDAGLRQYLGAAPPEGHGPHRYQFAVYALDVEDVGVDPDSSIAFLNFNLLGHTLARGVLSPTYER